MNITDSVCVSVRDHVVVGLLVSGQLFAVKLLFSR